MDAVNVDGLVSLLRERGIELAPGLTDAEVARVEDTYGFRLPPDLRVLLQHVLPVGRGFPDWRNGDEAVLHEWLTWPLEGMCFDIEHNTFWLEEWGLRPPNLPAAFEVARRAVAEAPRLIPIYQHRFIPDEPQLAGNPVFSVHQMDIIYYGADLAHYFANEFSYYKPQWTTPPVREIRFWGKLTSW